MKELHQSHRSLYRRAYTPCRQLALGGVVAAVALLLIPPVQAAKFEYHGDMDHRATAFDNQLGFLSNNGVGVINGKGGEDNFAEFKYRLWAEAGTNNDAVKGIFAIEIGSVRFGRDGSVGKSRGGLFSGDAVNIETRWAYTDFAIPGAQDHRIKVGLQPHNVNKHLWKETAAGINVSGPLNFWKGADYTFAWMRGFEEFSRGKVGTGFRDLDGFNLNLGFTPTDATKASVFVLHQRNNQNPAGGTEVRAEKYGIKQFPDSDLELTTFGTTGTHKFGAFDLGWTGMYQTGDIKSVNFKAADAVNIAGDPTSFSGNADVEAFFGRLDLSRTFGNFKVGYTFWYSSGDDDPTDGDFDAFLATDVDMTESAIFFEGKPTSDRFYTERPYILDKGLIFNKLELQHKTTPKLKLTGSVAYFQLAEDVSYIDDLGRAQFQDSLGFEFQGKADYKLYKNLTLTGHIAYLLADDAMDFFETGTDISRDGNSDEDILSVMARLRYKF